MVNPEVFESISTPMLAYMYVQLSFTQSNVPEGYTLDTHLFSDPLDIASMEPMPRYRFSLTPSWKKYSPGASSVPASMEPIITTPAPIPKA